MSMVDNIHSSRRENLIEHVFIGEVLRHLWRLGCHEVDVLRAETDAGGYDLVIEANSIIRHIQLKSSALQATTSSQKVHEELWKKPCGCVIWVRFDPVSMSIGPYRWHGARPGTALTERSKPSDFKIAKHAKGNSKGVKTERKNIRVINSGKFDKLDSIAELVEHLFNIPSQAV
ncbi:hypothetical protein [Sulfuritalea hydrogenivorans]|jgi:hypothetical protein|uniref:Uncharacterized protein n=1 Tax=Sulfuritalea hydrogenivorans sk43H TaxID=1223802 RepID=W0SFE4_9PROT|nr:hypothetical protein [Sulfuritalea hydrogenivorans]BAO29682.1 hypothetical protein SUTH_01890 [Sulfuritalea hydrogenivorans sk43H]